MTTATPVLSATSLQGNSVKNSADEDLGSIKDFMVDTSSGRIAYAVLSFGGFLGFGDKLFAVPFTALRVDTDCECFRMDATKEMLEDAHGFDQDNWPDMADQRWQEKVHDVYGVEPYWRG